MFRHIPCMQLKSDGIKGCIGGCIHMPVVTHSLFTSHTGKIDQNTNVSAREHANVHAVN